MAYWNQPGPFEHRDLEPPNMLSSSASGGHVVSCFVPHGVGLTMKMSRSGPPGLTWIPPTPPGAPPSSQLSSQQSAGSGGAFPRSSSSWNSFGDASITTQERAQETTSSFGTNSSGYLNPSSGGYDSWTTQQQSSVEQSHPGGTFSSATTLYPQTPPSSNRLRSQESVDWERRFLNSSVSSGSLLSSTMKQTPPPMFAPRSQIGAPPPGPTKRRPPSCSSSISTEVLAPIPPSGSQPQVLRSSPSGGDSFAGIARGPSSSRPNFGGLSPIPMDEEFQPFAPSPAQFHRSRVSPASSFIPLDMQEPFPVHGSDAEKLAWWSNVRRSQT